MGRKRTEDEMYLAELPVPEAINSATIESEEKVKIPFTIWFSKMVKLGRIREHQEEALLVFLKKQGVSQLSDEDSYLNVFKKF